MTLQEELEWTKAQLEEYRGLFQMHVDAVRVANAYVELAKAEQKQLKTMKKQFDLAMALVDKLKAEIVALTPKPEPLKLDSGENAYGIPFKAEQ